MRTKEITRTQNSDEISELRRELRGEAGGGSKSEAVSVLRARVCPNLFFSYICEGKRSQFCFLIISAIVLAIAVFVSALTDEELGAELAQLEGELVDANYSWLINYSGELSNKTIEVRNG